MSTILKLCNKRKPYAPQQPYIGRSFDKVLYCMYNGCGVASREQLELVTANHAAEGKGVGFIKYLERMGVLINA